MAFLSIRATPIDYYYCLLFLWARNFEKKEISYLKFTSKRQREREEDRETKTKTMKMLQLGNRTLDDCEQDRFFFNNFFCSIRTKWSHKVTFDEYQLGSNDDFVNVVYAVRLAHDSVLTI